MLWELENVNFSLTRLPSAKVPSAIQRRSKNNGIKSSTVLVARSREGIIENSRLAKRVSAW